MAGTRKNYTDDALQRAVNRVLAGEAAGQVSKESDIPYSTLRKWVAVESSGIPAVPKRRGPPPLLPAEAKRCLFEWVVGRQQVGYPAERREVISKARAISELLCGRSVGDRWYRRFVERNPGLVVRRSQSLAKVWNSVDVGDVNQLFHTLAKLIIEMRLHPSQLFNVDETAFETRAKNKHVVAVRGSKNVRSTDTIASFHLTIVACGGADGTVIPPLFTLPGKTLRPDVLDGCSQAGAAVTTTESGFINAKIFKSWLRFFAAAVPSSVRRPLVLLMDGCRSHYSTAILDTATSLQILLVCLPSNATHLFQPLDVAVFGSFKSKLRCIVNDYGNDGTCSVDKAAAVKLASLAWDSCNFAANIVAEFRACGLFPLSLPRMHECLSNFERNCTPRGTKITEWLKIKNFVQGEVLALPPPKKKSTRQRSTVTVASRLLTHQLLSEATACDRAARKKKGSSGRCGSTEPRQSKKRCTDSNQTIPTEAVV